LQVLLLVVMIWEFDGETVRAVVQGADEIITCAVECMST